MTLEVEIQRESEAPGIPEQSDFEAWADAALLTDDDAEVVIRVVDEAESAQLNQEYRHKQGATNVLSFPFEAPEEVPLGLLGDLVICAPVIAREAREQQKSIQAHWAHMVVHGMLHLQGYDHMTDEEAEEMEALETRIVTGLGFPAPYEVNA